MEKLNYRCKNQIGGDPLGIHDRRRGSVAGRSSRRRRKLEAEEYLAAERSRSEAEGEGRNRTEETEASIARSWSDMMTLSVKEES